MSTTTELMTTAEALHSQWLEPTGRNMLDSGGAYGRNWQRNQGKPVEAWTEAPEVTVDDWGVTVNTFQLLLKHLTYTPRSARLEASFRRYVERTPEGEAYFNAHDSVEDWLDQDLGVTPEDNLDSYNSYNTYNFETLLDSTLQAVEFPTVTGRYIALSYHGGCDVRGGYTDYKVYEVCGDYCLLAAYGDAYLMCSNSECEVRCDIRGGYSVESQEGTDADIDLTKPCPECGSAWAGYTSECYGGY